MDNAALIQEVTKKANVWLNGDYDAETKKGVKNLLDNPDKTDLIEAFYKDLEFGTGGLRGIMGVGTNRMNIYTVGSATQGLANYLKKQFKNQQIKVAIGMIAVTTAVSLPRPQPMCSHPTASRYICSRVSVQLPKCHLPFVSWVVRAVLYLLPATILRSTTDTRLIGTMVASSFRLTIPT